MRSSDLADRHTRSTVSASQPLVAVLGGLAAVGVATALAHQAVTILPAAYVVSIFLVAVLIAAALFGPWSGLAAAAASFFVFNFFFVEPTYTFAVGDPRDVFALGVFLVAALVTGSLAGRLRETADAARRRADTLAMLQAFAERIAATGDPAVVRSLVARHLAECIGGQAILVDRGGGPSEGWPAPIAATAEEQAAIATVFAAPTATTAEAGRFAFRPLATADGVVAVVGLERTAMPTAGFDGEDGLSALIEQAAVALERTWLAEESAEARAAAERERLRSALLSSISHDLRTPLATILGSVTSLRQLGDRMEPEDRADLLAAIEEETERLSRFVGDLFLMTRIEAGLDVRRDAVDVGEVVTAAAASLRRMHGGHPVRASRPAEAMVVRGDATLLGQVLFNLGDNAAKASPAGSAIDLAVTADGETVQIAVTDRGRGVGPEEARRLFAIGGGSGAAPTPSGHGGLGLVIVGRVVVAMGGTITAESRTRAVPGTCVTLRLPRVTGETPSAIEGGER